jgi:peptide deformylase
MTLPVRLYTDPILSKVCKPIEDFNDPSLEQLIQEMIVTMVAYNGVGLAAPQVGEDKQLAVLHVENRTKILVIANPKILRSSKEKDKQMEGCLSCPGVSLPVKRCKGIEVEVQNLSGEKIQYRFTDFDARIFMHEFDHLCGVTIAHKGLKNYLPKL